MKTYTVHVSALADEIERMTDTHDQLNLIITVLSALEGSEFYQVDIQCLADALQCVADGFGHDPEPCDLEELRLALGRKHNQRIGRV